MAAVNNVTRMLDSRNIQYTACGLPPEKLSALETARILGTRPELVYKTIVVTCEPPARALLVLVPAHLSVDLKKVAASVGAKKARLPTEREAEALTGLEAGGISPLALLNRGFHVLLDTAAREILEVHVSGGRRGLNIKLKVQDLQEITKARFADVSVPSQPEQASADQRTTL